MISGSVASSTAITDTIVANNSASNGGGVWLSRKLFSTRSAIANNHASFGGGVYVDTTGSATIENTTLSGNGAGRDGGAIYANDGSAVYLYSITMAYNKARLAYPSSGAGGGAFITATGAVTATDSIMANNTIFPLSASYNDCMGTLRSRGYNFIGSNGGCTISGITLGNQVGGVFPANLNPQIAPLEPITGLTPGHLPLAGSPVIDAGPLLGCLAHSGTLLIDQIGHSRQLNGRCDIGAVEYFILYRDFLPLMGK